MKITQDLPWDPLLLQPLLWPSHPGCYLLTFLSLPQLVNATLPLLLVWLKLLNNHWPPPQIHLLQVWTSSLRYICCLLLCYHQLCPLFQSSHFHCHASSFWQHLSRCNPPSAYKHWQSQPHPLLISSAHNSPSSDRQKRSQKEVKPLLDLTFWEGKGMCPGALTIVWANSVKMKGAYALNKNGNNSIAAVSLHFLVFV